MLNIYNKKQLNILVYIDDTAEEILAIQNLEEQQLKVKTISKMSEFKKDFKECEVLLLGLNDEKVLLEAGKYIKKNKFNQYVMLCISRGLGSILEEMTICRIDVTIFKPHDFNIIHRKLNKLYNERIVLQEVMKIKNMEKEELIKEHSFFIKQSQNELLDINFFYQNMLNKKKIDIINHLDKLLEKYKSFNNLPNLAQIIYSFIYKLFISKDRENDIKKISTIFLYNLPHCRAEEKIYSELVSYIFSSFKKEDFGISEEKMNYLLVLFEFEIRMIGLTLKYKIQKNIVSKENELTSESLHYLMIGISHIQNNLILPVAQRCRAVRKYTSLIHLEDSKSKEKANKYLSIIKKDSTAIFDYQSFLNQTSELFTSFKSDNKFKNTKNLKYLEFLLELTFKNAICIKSSDTVGSGKITLDIFIRDNIKDIEISLHENILLSCIYAIIQNAIKSQANYIKIDISAIDKEVIISISNNGIPIEDNIKNNIFDAHVGNANSTGLGLFISKRLLKDIGSGISLENSNIVEFKITIPIKERS